VTEEKLQKTNQRKMEYEQQAIDEEYEINKAEQTTQLLSVPLPSTRSSTAMKLKDEKTALEAEIEAVKEQLM
jgi:hypothetical protein